MIKATQDQVRDVAQQLLKPFVADLTARIESVDDEFLQLRELIATETSRLLLRVDACAPLGAVKKPELIAIRAEKSARAAERAGKGREAGDKTRAQTVVADVEVLRKELRVEVGEFRRHVNKAEGVGRATKSRCVALEERVQQLGEMSEAVLKRLSQLENR